VQEENTPVNKMQDYGYEKGDRWRKQQQQQQQQQQQPAASSWIANDEKSSYHP